MTDHIGKGLAIFAGISIFAIIRTFSPDPKERGPGKIDASVEGDHQRIIIGTTCRLIIPVIQIFALYVVAHGHHSPGGGFQGGVMLGASFILVAIARDLGAALTRLSEKQYFRLAFIGIFIYSGFGMLCMVLERNLLDYGILQKIMPATDAVMARSHSMLGVEVGVGTKT